MRGAVYGDGTGGTRKIGVMADYLSLWPCWQDISENMPRPPMNVAKGNPPVWSTVEVLTDAEGHRYCDGILGGAFDEGYFVRHRTGAHAGRKDNTLLVQ